MSLIRANHLRAVLSRSAGLLALGCIASAAFLPDRAEAICNTRNLDNPCFGGRGFDLPAPRPTATRTSTPRPTSTPRATSTPVAAPRPTPTPTQTRAPVPRIVAPAPVRPAPVAAPVVVMPPPPPPAPVVAPLPPAPVAVVVMPPPRPAAAIWRSGLKPQDCKPGEVWMTALNSMREQQGICMAKRCSRVMANGITGKPECRN